MSLCLGRLQDTKFAAGVRARQEPVDAHSGTYTDFLRRHERAANKAIQEGPHAVKAMLPQLVDRIADSRNLRAAWDHLARHGGATPGPNGITYRDVEGSEIWELMRTLGRSIREGTYQPGPTRQLRISKGPDRGYRTLTLHNIEDRVVQRAIVQIVQPILDYRFDEHSYGFRPNRGRLNALATAVAESQRGRTTWITEDIKTAFDRVPHGRLQDVLQKRLPDQRLMDLMGTINSNRQKRGIPQGSPLAPLLLNLYLDYHLDRVWRKRSPDQPLLRYADDLLIPCKTRQEATEARKRLERTLTPTGMLLKGTPDTAIRDLSDGDEAEWLGYAVRLEEDGLRIHVTEDAWWELRERLALAHTEELAPLRIVSVLSGWVDQFGPCLPHTDVAAVYARIKEEAGKLAFDEIPGEADVRERIHRAYERWEVLRGRAKGSFTGLVTDGGSACLSTATKRRNGEGAPQGAPSTLTFARADCVPPSNVNVTPARRDVRRQAAGDPATTTTTRAASSTTGACEMQTPKPRRRIESRPLADLRPHPRQAELFGEGSDHEIEELAADIRKNGVIHPIEITSDNTLIAGHRRVKALRHLQRIQVHCWVREDLEQLGENAVEQRLIEDNLNRRQMSRLEQARAYRRLKALQYSGNTETGEAVDGDLRDFLATRFDTSGRTLDRWSRLLDVPREIQQAVEVHMLTLTQGTKVADLPPSTQREMAERIRQGKDPKEVFDNYLGSPPVYKSSIESTIAKLVRAIDECENVRDKLGDSTPATVTSLKRAARKLDELVNSIAAKPPLKKQRPAKQTK